MTATNPWDAPMSSLCQDYGHQIATSGKCVRCGEQVQTPTYDPGQTDHLTPPPSRHCCEHYAVGQGCPLHGDAE